MLLALARCVCVVPVEQALFDELNEEDQDALDRLAGHTYTHTDLHVNSDIRVAFLAGACIHTYVHV